MRIPIYTAMQEKKQLQFAQFEAAKAESEYNRERLSTVKEMRKMSQDAVDKLVNRASSPAMSLNQELYGSNNKPYAAQIWEDSPSTARRISRIAYWSSPEAQAMIGRFVDLVYGPRLELQSMPVWELIKGAPESNEDRSKIVKLIESKYRLWAKAKYSDYTEERNHYQLSRYNFEKLLIDGAYINILRYSSSRKRNPLSVQYIRPENLMRVDSKVSNGNTEKNGIEYNFKGAAVAYHIMDSTTGKSKRIPKYGPRSGRQLVIHNKIGDSRDGVGILAGVTSSITKIADFQAIEIQAAVINALFAVWVETEKGGDNKKAIPKGGIAGNSFTGELQDRISTSEYQSTLNSTQFSKGGIIVQNMGEGQKLNSFDTKRPTANFEQFYNLVCRSLYSAKGMSYAVATYNFNGSYSAARGELLVFWNKVMTLRFDHSTDYEDIIYKMWMLGEVDNDKLKLPGFEDEETRDAWCNAYWNGPSRPDIDPMRSAKAHEIEDKNCYKSSAMITAERGGGDFDDNIERKRNENILKAEVNTPIVTLEKTSHSFSENKTESKTESKTVEE